jgi:predicted nucleic acid-binding protein
MADEGPIVCNAGPLIALSMIGQLDLLESLYERVLVPEAVLQEVSGDGLGRIGAAEVKAASWLERIGEGTVVDPLLATELGPGEAAVIAAAHRLGAGLVLIDERRARRIAEHAYRLRVKGSAGILVSAKRAGLIAAVRPFLTSMVSQGYYLSERLVERATQEAGEAATSYPAPRSASRSRPRRSGKSS